MRGHLYLDLKFFDQVGDLFSSCGEILLPICGISNNLEFRQLIFGKKTISHKITRFLEVTVNAQSFFLAKPEPCEETWVRVKKIDWRSYFGKAAKLCGFSSKILFNPDSGFSGFLARKPVKKHESGSKRQMNSEILVKALCGAVFEKAEMRLFSKAFSGPWLRF